MPPPVESRCPRVSAVSAEVEIAEETHRHVDRDECKPNHRTRVPPLAALWPVAEGEDEAHDEQAEVCII